MERKELKQLLKNMEINEDLTEMPAVVEPIYQAVQKKQSEVPNLDVNLWLSGKIEVLENGDFSFGGFSIEDKKSIALNEQGGAEITSYPDESIKTNEFGIETELSSGDWMGPYESIIRKDGELRHTSGNNGNALSWNGVFLDKGSWSIRKSEGVLLSGDDFLEEPTELNGETILSEFNNISASVIKDYPKTEQWYITQRENIKRIIARENPVKRLEKKIEMLTNENKRLQDNNSYLVSKNSSLSKMLSKSLDFIESVKKSPVGKVFFGKRLKSLNSGDEEKER